MQQAAGSRIGWFGSFGVRLDEPSVATETDILLLSDDLRQLVDAAEERGNLRQSELNDVLEPLRLDPLETDAVYRELESRSIDVVLDVDEDGEPIAKPSRRRSRSRSPGRRRPTRCSSSCARPAGIRC